MKKIIRLLFVVLLLLVSALVYFIFLRPSTIISKQEAKAKYSLPESKFLQWRGGEVHYVDEGNGFPILMIHGLAGSHRNFGRISERLKNEFRCIRIDLPGFGLSDLPEVPGSDYRKLYMDFFSFFFDTLQLDSFYLMGNSMGGWMSWEIAARYPERVKILALYCSAGYDMEAVAERLSKGMRSSSALVEKLMSRGIPYSVTKRNVEKCFADVTTIKKEEVDVASAFANRETNFRTILELLRHRENADTSLIKKIKAPTLITWGKQDQIIPYTHAARFHRDLPGSKLIIYDDCGHIPMIEKTDAVEKDFREFLTERISITSIEN